MWFALLKNPLTKLIAEKTIGAVTHKLKKDAILKQKDMFSSTSFGLHFVSFLVPKLCQKAGYTAPRKQLFLPQFFALRGFRQASRLDQTQTKLFF